jgi:hypothetical protein
MSYFLMLLALLGIEGSAMYWAAKTKRPLDAALFNIKLAAFNVTVALIFTIAAVIKRSQ